MPGLIREEEVTPQRGPAKINQHCLQEPGRRARAHILRGHNQRDRTVKLERQEFTDFRELSQDMRFNISKDLRVWGKT